MVSTGNCRDDQTLATDPARTARVRRRTDSARQQSVVARRAAVRGAAGAPLGVRADDQGAAQRAGTGDGAARSAPGGQDHHPEPDHRYAARRWRRAPAHLPGAVRRHPATEAAGNAGARSGRVVRRSGAGAVHQRVCARAGRPGVPAARRSAEPLGLGHAGEACGGLAAGAGDCHRQFGLADRGGPHGCKSRCRSASPAFRRRRT